MVFNGPSTGITVYRDGQAQGTDAFHSSSFSVGNGQLVIGRRFVDANHNYVSVEMDELIFWNRILSQQEVQELYTQYN